MQLMKPNSLCLVTANSKCYLLSTIQEQLLLQWLGLSTDQAHAFSQFVLRKNAARLK